MFSRDRLIPPKVKPGPGRTTLDAYRELLSLVVSTCKRTVACFEELLGLQRELMQGVELFLALDEDFADEAAIALVQDCARVFETMKFDCKTFDDIQTVGKETLQECAAVETSLAAYNEASERKHHYESKIASLERQGSRCDRVARNWGKFEESRKVLAQRSLESECNLGRFLERRFVHVRATLIAYLRAYSAVVADFGACAEPVAEAFAAELKPGSHVTITGLQQRHRSWNGMDAVVECMAEDGCCTVATPKGGRKSVRAEHLLPMSLEQPSLQDLPSTNVTGIVFQEDQTAVAEARGGGISQSLKDDVVETALPPALGFGACGLNIELESLATGKAESLPIIARRAQSVLHGVVLTAERLSSEVISEAKRRVFFEVRVLDAASKGTSRTLSLGFVWPSPAEASSFCCSRGTNGRLSGRRSLSFDNGHRAPFPENAKDMPHAVVIGDGLPKLHIGGVEVQKLTGWRPLRQIATGCLVGCLLEQAVDVWRISVLQDRKPVCSAEFAPRPWATGAPYGVVDVCGAVKRVEMQQIDRLPSPQQPGPYISA
eukprot:TRINITY_DN47466_c0_g1_i1.p1 TRINITY_DN47466_c0_g1~~TRINITY_DN47466_c0_g1_i1.p1  ORF type:complete len:548 (-),score=129.88 TRINITY_DN47466_c0_g1_i1:84-1727(-)